MQDEKDEMTREDVLGTEGVDAAAATEGNGTGGTTDAVVDAAAAQNGTPHAPQETGPAPDKMPTRIRMAKSEGDGQEGTPAAKGLPEEFVPMQPQSDWDPMRQDAPQAGVGTPSTGDEPTTPATSPDEDAGPAGANVGTGSMEATGAVEQTQTEAEAVSDEDTHDHDEDKRKASPLARLNSMFGRSNRLPVVLGIITVACLIIAATSFGLQWMARHGGGTGDPVEASSDVDNTPIPMPRISSVNALTLSLRSNMTFRISSDEKWLSWDGTTMEGDLPIGEVSSANDTTTIPLTPFDGMEELVIDFACQDAQSFVSLSSSMSTEENGTLSISANINGLPSAGTAHVDLLEYRVGVTNTDEAATRMPVATVTTSYTVGDGDKDYVGSYVSCSASLSLGAGTTEAYVAAKPRVAEALAPNGFGTGDILQTGRTTIRPDGRQNSIMGTALPKRGETEFSATYENLAENDESSSIMGQDVAHVSDTRQSGDGKGGSGSDA